MSSASLSFSALSDGQDSPNFTSNSSQELYNSSNRNYFGCNNNQMPLLPPVTPILAWNGNSQINQGSSYQMQSHNSSVFNQGGHETPHVQQMQYLQDTIAKLQAENTSLKGERTAIQNAYNTLVSQLAVNNPNSSMPAVDGPINVTLHPIPLTMPLLHMECLPQLDRAKYPKVCFWTKTEWQTWLTQTAEGQGASPSSSFLEDENGDALTSQKIGDILETARDIWHGFRKHGLIDMQTTWTSMSLSTKKAFRVEVERSWPQLTLCEDQWKSDMIGKKNYGSFKQTWFTNKSDERGSRTGKRKVKKEGDDSISSLPRAKRVRLSPSPSPDGGNSSTGGSNTSAQMPTPTSTSSSKPALGPLTPSISSSLCYTSPDADVLGPQLYDDTGAPACEQICNDADKPGSQLDDDAGTPGKKIPKSTASDPAQSSTVQRGNAVVAIPTPVVKNPLLSMCPSKPLVDAMRPPQQTSSTPAPSTAPVTLLPGSNDHMNASRESSQIDQVGTRSGSSNHTDMNPSLSESSTQMLPGPALQPPTQTVPVKTFAEKKTWRPPSNKSARTLCMHRYQRQVGGSVEEFNAYFEALSADAKAKYKDETKQLVATGVWINGTADVIAKFSGLPMY